MVQVLQRICIYTKTISKGECIVFCNMYISNIFWCIIVWYVDCFSFPYLHSQSSGETVIVVVPSALYMVWVKSPAYFSCATKTIRYLIKHNVDIKTPISYYLVKEKLMVSNFPSRGQSDQLSKMLQVYIDYFWNSVTQSRDRAQIPTVIRALVHIIYTVMSPT